MRRFDSPPRLLTAVAFGAFLETTILPVPFELLLIPLMLARPRWLWSMALAALAGCLVGALTGYVVGAIALETIGRGVLAMYDAEAMLDDFSAQLNYNGFWALLLVGFTPVPIQLATLGAGVATYPVVLFMLAMLLSRAVRYLGLAWLVSRFGASTTVIVRRYRRMFLIAGLALVPIIIWLLWPGTSE